MESQGIVPFLIDRLQLNIAIPSPRNFMRKWRDLADRVDHLRKEVVISLVGKYTKLEDSYASVTKALQHASIFLGYKLQLKVNNNSSLIEQFCSVTFFKLINYVIDLFFF